eukprot:9478677-Pyramimonas_sp.AAC.1
MPACPVCGRPTTPTIATLSPCIVIIMFCPPAGAGSIMPPRFCVAVRAPAPGRGGLARFSFFASLGLSSGAAPMVVRVQAPQPKRTAACNRSQRYKESGHIPKAGTNRARGASIFLWIQGVSRGGDRTLLSGCSHRRCSRMMAGGAAALRSSDAFASAMLLAMRMSGATHPALAITTWQEEL